MPGKVVILDMLLIAPTAWALEAMVRVRPHPLTAGAALGIFTHNSPGGNRTRVSRLRTWNPVPLDDRAK